MSGTGPASGAPSPLPLVSVVIPTRNRWDTLARFALRSALDQRDVGFEVVIVDDCSASDPPEDGLFADSRVRLVRLNDWGGVTVARNTGIEQAAGEWVAFLDDDDLWAPDKLGAIIAEAQRTDADFGYSAVLSVNAALRPLIRWEAVAPDDLREVVREGNAIHAISSNLVVRRALLERIGGFDEGFPTLADIDMVQQLAREGQPCAVERPLVAYHASDWLLADEPAHRADLERLEAKYEDVSIDWSVYERWIALSLHRAGRRREAAGRYLAAAWRFRDLRSLVQAGSVVIPRDRIDHLRRPGLRAPQWLSAYGGPRPGSRSSTP